MRFADAAKIDTYGSGSSRFSPYRIPFGDASENLSLPGTSATPDPGWSTTSTPAGDNLSLPGTSATPDPGWITTPSVIAGTPTVTTPFPYWTLLLGAGALGLAYYLWRKSKK